MKLAIDIDGVIADLYSNIIEMANRKNVKLLFDQYKPTVISNNKKRIDSEKFIMNIIHELFSSRMDSIKPYHDAVKYIPTLDQDLGPITFLTARDTKYNKQTLNWLHKHFKISFILANKQSDEKLDFLKKYEYTTIIEDRLKTANLITETDNGITTYLINRQWNTGRKTNSKIIRINSLCEVNS
jgi:uncharacterized HAD superfamily protein